MTDYLLQPVLDRERVPTTQVSVRVYFRPVYPLNGVVYPS